MTVHAARDITYFTAGELTGWRERLQKAAGSDPKPGDAGPRGDWGQARWWSSLDFEAALRTFSHLSLRPGWRLVGLTGRGSHGGGTRVLAVPAGSGVPPRGHGSREEDERRVFESAEARFMRAVRGDGTPRAFLEAMVFALVAGSLGNYWHSVGFDAEVFLDLDDPSGEEGGFDDRFEGEAWSWLDRESEVDESGSNSGRRGTFEPYRPERHADMRPRVILQPGGATALFYTGTSFVNRQVRRQRAEFAGGSLDFEHDARTVAVGGRGWIP